MKKVDGGATDVIRHAKLWSNSDVSHRSILQVKWPVTALDDHQKLPVYLKTQSKRSFWSLVWKFI